MGIRESGGGMPLATAGPAMAASILDVIGRTPLIPLRRLAEGLPARVFVKLESVNPGGSVKDPDVIAAANERKMTMICTGVRHFKH